MKIINDLGVGKGVIFRAGGQFVCGLCRKEVEVSQECEHCSNSFKDGIVDVDHANRITDSFFNLLFPKEDMYDESSDYRPKVLYVGKSYDVIRSCEKAEQVDRMHVRERFLSEAGIPKRYCFLNWSDFYTKLDLTELESLCSNNLDGEIIYLHGDNNTGKTLLMSILLQRFLDSNRSVLFITPERIADLYAKHWYSDNSEGRSDLEKARDLDVVGVDDLFDPKKVFVGKNGGLIIPSVDSFLRYRIHNRLTTIVTTNFSLPQIGQTDFHQTGKLLERGQEKFRILLT